MGWREKWRRFKASDALKNEMFTPLIQASEYLLNPLALYI
jgi:hypothetical protein